MATYRERRLAKADRLRDWAEKRNATATAALNSNPELRRDWAFITQPGHIPERARMNASDDRAHESLRKAASMESRAAGIEAAADRAIYSDDPDAIENLEAKLESLTAKRERMALANKLYRKGDREGLAALGFPDLDKLRAEIATRYSWEQKGPYRPYELSNLGGVISTTRKRIEEVKARQARDIETDEAGGFKITRGDIYCRVQFSERPERDIINALKAAGFTWGSGCWGGYIDKLPACVLELEEATREEHFQDLGSVDFDSEGAPR